MIQIPSVIKGLFNTDGIRKNIRVNFPNGEHSDLTNADIESEFESVSVSLTESLSSQPIIKFGLCESPCLEFTCHGIPNIKGMTIKVTMEIDVSSLTAEEIAEYGSTSADVDFPFYSVPYGIYKVKKCVRSGDTDKRKVTAYSKLAYYDGKEVNEFLDVLTTYTWYKSFYFYLTSTMCMKLISPSIFVNDSQYTNVSTTVPFGYNNYNSGILSPNYTKDGARYYPIGQETSNYYDKLTSIAIRSDFLVNNETLSNIAPLCSGVSMQISGQSYRMRFVSSDYLYDRYIKTKMDIPGLYSFFDSVCDDISESEYGSAISCDLDLATLNTPTTPIYIDEQGEGLTEPVYIKSNRDTSIVQKGFITPYYKITEGTSPTYSIQQPFYSFSELKYITIPNDGSAVYIPGLKLDSGATNPQYNNDVNSEIKVCPFKDGTGYYMTNWPSVSTQYDLRLSEVANIYTNLYAIKNISINVLATVMEVGSRYKVLSNYESSITRFTQFFGTSAGTSGTTNDGVIRISKTYGNIKRVYTTDMNGNILRDYSFNNVNDTGYLYVGRNYIYDQISMIRVEYDEDLVYDMDLIYLETFKGTNNTEYIVQKTADFSNDNYIKLYRDSVSTPRISENSSVVYEDIIKKFSSGNVSTKVMTSSNITYSSTTRINLTLSTQNQQSLKNEITNFVNGLGEGDVRKMIESYLEIQGKFGMIDRTTGDLKIVDLTDHLMLYPSEDVFPAQDQYPRGTDAAVYRSSYRSVEYDDAPTKHYDRIECTWTDNNNTEHYQYYDIVDHDAADYDPDDYQTYSLTDNYFIKNKYYTTSQIDDILETLGEKIKDFQYYPCNIDMRGLPYLETGDGISVVTRDSGFTTYILRRVLKGINVLEDNIEAQ